MRDETTRHLVPGERAGEVVQAFRDRVSGVPVSEISRRLGMTPNGVRQLVRNRVYLGELRVGKHVNETAHEPIVDRDLFDAAQSKTPRPGRGPDKAPSLLAGLVRCAGCGHVMSRTGKHASAAYSCARHHSGSTCPEPASITSHLLDAAVEITAVAELKRLSVTASSGDGLKVAQAAVQDAEREIAVYLESVSAASVGAEAFAKGATQRREAVEEAQEALRVERVRAPLLPQNVSGDAVWADLDGRERNALLRALLSGVIVRRGGGRGSRTPLADRVRVLVHGADVSWPKSRGGRAAGILSLDLPDLDDERVLRIPGRQDPT